MREAIPLKLLQSFEKACSLLPCMGRMRPIKGRFSAFKHAQEGKLTSDTLIEGQHEGINHADSVNFTAGLKQHNHQPWPIFWCHSHQARLTGRSLQWRNHKDEICLEGNFHVTKRRRFLEDRIFAQILLPSPHRLKGTWTSIVSNWGSGANYYHWMLDCLTRLLVREHLPVPAKILIPENSRPFVQETIRMLGIETECIEAPAHHLLIEDFYFCSPTSMTGAWNPIGYTWLREKFRPFYSSKISESGRRIFLTRRNSSRIPHNINQIEGLFIKDGFEIIDCGTLTVSQQIETVSSASAIAGLHGAAMTNILWAAPDTPVLEIFEKSYLNSCFEQIAHHGNLAYQYQILDGKDDITSMANWIHSVT